MHMLSSLLEEPSWAMSGAGYCEIAMCSSEREAKRGKGLKREGGRVTMKYDGHNSDSLGSIRPRKWDFHDSFLQLCSASIGDLGDNFVVSPLPVESSKYHSSCGGARFPFSENVIREKSNVCNHVYPESYGTSYSVNVITSQWLHGGRRARTQILNARARKW